MDCKEGILSEDVYDYITDFSLEGLEAENAALCYATIDNNFNIVYFQRRVLPSLEVDYFEYQSVPKLYGLMQVETGNNRGAGNIFDPNNLTASGITQVQGPPLNLTGRGVILCFIDTGIDYTNPVFLDESRRSRILAIWDQTIQTGTPPEGFLYGSEYTREDINRALQSDDPYEVVPSRDENGHGSALASVAAGSNVRAGMQFVGAAPNADIVVVKLKECKQYLRDFYLIPQDVPAYQENDIMLAVKYVDSFAVVAQRPIVICFGMGTNMGDHAGSMALSRYLDMIAIKRSRAVVVCGGNEGNALHHFQGNLLQSSFISPDGLRTGESQAGIYQDVEIRVNEGSMGFFMEFWGNMPDVYNIRVISPGGETIPAIRLGARQGITYGFVFEKSRITIDSALVEPSSGVELILFRLQEPTAGIWTFRVMSTGNMHSGIFNIWLPITEFLNVPVYFLAPSPYITLTESAMASNVISVSTYNADNRSFYINSGRGYSRTNEIRPDFAAPGVDVSTVSGSRTGSSYAAAITAGAVAQFMQWAVIEGNNEFVDSREIKSYFIRGAQRNVDTEYPNREWGYGRLDLQGVFQSLLYV